MTPYEQEKKIRQAHIAREVIEVILLVVVISVAIKLSIDTRFVSGDSMMPGLPPGQLVMVNKLAYVFGSPQRGDIIVFNYPLNPQEQFIKRIIGLPGDTIHIDPTQVTVDGQVLSEPYISKPSNDHVGTITLGPNQYWVMGDHRDVSCDSRSWGELPRDDIIGKVTIVYWPINAIHGVNTYSDTFANIHQTAGTKPENSFPQTNDCLP